MLPRGASIDVSSLFTQCVDGRGLSSHLVRVAGDYLSAREALDTLTGYFMPEIDPTGQYSHIGEVVAGSVFMCIDAAERTRLIDEQIQSFHDSVEGFAF